MKFVHECTFRVVASPGVPVGPGPVGTRVFMVLK